MRYWSVSKPLVIISDVLDFALLDFHRIGYVRIRMRWRNRQKSRGETNLAVSPYTLTLHPFKVTFKVTFNDYFLSFEIVEKLEFALDI